MLSSYLKIVQEGNAIGKQLVNIWVPFQPHETNGNK